MKHSNVTLYKAAAICDGQGIFARPGMIAVRHGRIMEAGAPKSISKRLKQNAKIIDKPNELLIPALVNAHAHLDLSSIEPEEYSGNFTAWLKNAQSQRPTKDKDIAKAVEKGLKLSRNSGVGYIGDIAGSAQSIIARRTAPKNITLAGVSYLETFGIGKRQTEKIKQAASTLSDMDFETSINGYDRGILLGIQPHAPYSAGQEVYKESIKLSRRAIYRLCTHMAESKEELEFVDSATGVFADMLKSMGKWDSTIKPTGKHPIDLLENELKKGRWLLAHCNYIEDRHIETLQKTGTSVVYCPVASDFFNHKNHKYQQMLDSAVNVCLGTDALMCQSKNGNQPLGIFTQMRYLYRRDNTDPYLLLRMATTNGMAALELSENDSTLKKRASAHFATIKIDPNDKRDPLEQALLNENPVKPLV